MSEVKPDIIGLTASIAVWLGKQFGDSGIMEVINGLHLKNKEGVKPHLIKTHKTDTGKDYIFSIPPGMTKNDFEKSRVAFETFTNSTIEIESAGKRLVIKSHKTKYEDVIKFKFYPSLYPEMLAPLPIGISPDGKVKVVDMANVYHMLIGGVTGYGKTSELLGITVSLLLSGCHVSVIDKKAIDFPILEDYLEVAISENEVLNMIKETVAEMERRASILRKAKVQKIQQLKEMSYRVLIIDEAADIEDNASWELIDKLVRKARAAGIGLILATQKPSANTSKGFTDIRSNLAGRLCYYVNGDSTDSQIVLGKGNSRGAELPAIAGRCIWKWKTEESLQSMFLDAEGAIKILEENNIPKLIKEVNGIGKGEIIDITAIEQSEIMCKT